MKHPALDYSIDTLKVHESILQFPDQCQQVINEVSQQHIPNQCYLAENIVISGMGGSALGGRIVASLNRQTLKIPIIISTDYHLPNFVDHRSLVIISSYSGNTAETVSSLEEARARNSSVYILASGGQLADLALRYHLPHYVFNPVHNPSSQPRMGLGYNILALITLLSRCQLIHPVLDLGSLPGFLRNRQQHSSFWLELAKGLVGRIPVLVAAEHLKGPVHAFRNQLNENSKTFAVYFDFPELNHHLLEGLSQPKSNPDNLAFLFIDSELYHPEVNRTYNTTKTAISKNNIPLNSLDTAGSSRLFQAMDVVQSGAFIAYYLALLNRIDPGPIPWVDWYKDEIRKVV